VDLRVVKDSGHVGFSDNPTVYFQILRKAIADILSGDDRRWKSSVSSASTPAPAASNGPA
jgi:hypothetical protein